MYMKKCVGPVGALIVGHFLIQLGSGGAVSPPASTGQVFGGGPGGKAPGSSKDLVFSTSQTARLFVFLSFWAELSHPA